MPFDFRNFLAKQLGGRSAGFAKANAPLAANATRKNILIALNRLGWSGGVLRFERFGRVARERGHNVALLPLSGVGAEDCPSSLPVITFDEAKRHNWDATMVPGAGFPLKIIESFSQFDSGTFGVRIMHVLNDQSRRERFLKLNAAFKPHIVVFNNRHWTPGSFTDFRGNQFYFIEGAVDSSAFAPQRYRKTDSRYVIGGLARKNPAPLVEAVRRLGSNFELRLFGPPRDLSETAADLIATGQLNLVGNIPTDELPEFYRGLDCVVHTDSAAGWANLAAEAMASGVPVICTEHGTLAFAKDDVTALVVEPAADAIAAALTRLQRDSELQQRLSENGRAAISQFTWERYATELLGLLDLDCSEAHYVMDPQVGLYGKWPMENRLLGLEGVMRDAQGKTILDLGAAEGMIAKSFLDAGAAFVHGVELDRARSAKARALCPDTSRSLFEVADLGDWPAFRATLPTNASFDMVLYLGIHHHLPAKRRAEILSSAAKLARKHFVIRTPESFFASDDIMTILDKEGFAPESEAPGMENHGVLRVFVRRVGA